MQPRTEVAIAMGTFAVLALIALEAAPRRRGAVDTDPRSSSYLSGPQGLRAMAEVVERMGVRVVRWRGRTQALQAEAAEPATLVVADPSVTLRADDVLTILDWSASGGDLVLGGEGTTPVMRCLGYSPRLLVLDSVRVRAPSGRDAGWVHAELRKEIDAEVTIRDGPLSSGADAVVCPPAAISAADTVLRSVDGAPVAVRLTRRDTVTMTRDGSSTILLLSDMALLNNRGLREAEIPEILLGSLLSRSRAVVFDEYHQGFAQRGSVASAAIAWTRSSPWGWLFWQWAIVGLLAFVAGAVRFGPVRVGVTRKRRSPLEHVKALATALAAARGHDVAIASLVQGLRRRLQARSGAERTALAAEPWLPWAQRLEKGGRTPELRDRARRLTQFGTPGQPNSAVQDAAHAVEDVWEALHR
jgi:hypothetical protein